MASERTRVELQKTKYAAEENDPKQSAHEDAHNSADINARNNEAENHGIAELRRLLAHSVHGQARRDARVA